MEDGAPEAILGIYLLSRRVRNQCLNGGSGGQQRVTLLKLRSASHYFPSLYNQLPSRAKDQVPKFQMIIPIRLPSQVPQREDKLPPIFATLSSNETMIIELQGSIEIEGDHENQIIAILDASDLVSAQFNPLSSASHYSRNSYESQRLYFKEQANHTGWTSLVRRQIGHTLKAFSDSEAKLNRYRGQHRPSFAGHSSNHS
jgi:hypothetical protein